MKQKQKIFLDSNLIVGHVTQNGEGDTSGEKTSSGVDKTGDDRIPKIK